MGIKGNRRREEILRQSGKLFAEKGYTAVTMQQVCGSCRLSRGGLYRYFGSTKEIFEELLKRRTGPGGEKWKRLMEEGRPAPEILEQALAVLEMEMNSAETSLSLAVYEYSRVWGGGFIEELNRKAREKWKSLILYGMERGEFRDVDPEQMTDIILYVYQGVRLWSRVIPLGEKAGKNIVKKIRKDLVRET